MHSAADYQPWWLPGALPDGQGGGATRSLTDRPAAQSTDRPTDRPTGRPADRPAARYTITLRWFASEDEGRTEPPSEQRIRRAREEEGKVAKSADLNAAVILLVSVLVLAIFSRYLLNTLLEMMQFFLGRSGEPTIIESDFHRLLLRYFMRLALPVLIAAVVSALLSNLLQVGFLFTTKPLRPNFNRIAPKVGRYFKRVLFSAEAGFNLLKSWLKLLIIAVVGIVNVNARYSQIVNALHVPIAQSTLFLARLSFTILIQAAIIMLILALFDLQFQRFQHRESLKTTRHEAKEERKTQEGDPLIRSRMRQRFQAILNSNMVKNVPKADVVITNPTHYAIALEYKSARMDAPTVIAKGQDAIAQRIRDVAREHSIPLVENKPLARALFNEVEIGDIIPEQFYDAVVTILAELYKLNGIPVGVV